MKKLLISLALIFSCLLLVACGNSQASKSADKKTDTSKQSVTLIIKTDAKTTKEEVSFKKGATVRDVLKSKVKIEEKGGLITSINGIKQDQTAGKYWFFKVNGKLSNTGADQTKVKSGDKIEFYMDVYKWPLPKNWKAEGIVDCLTFRQEIEEEKELGVFIPLYFESQLKNLYYRGCSLVSL